MKHSSNRREFLSGKAARDAIADWTLPDHESAFSEAPSVPVDAATATTFVWECARRAMACPFGIFLSPGRRPGHETYALETLDIIDWLEGEMTIYRDDSQLARLNRNAGHQAEGMDHWLFELLQTAEGISRGTAGAFDITAGPLSRLWGFTRRAGRFPSDEELQRCLLSVGWQGLELEPAERTLRFHRAGMEINLGAIGKGYAIDRVAEQLLAFEVRDFLVHAGYSSLRACGTRSKTAESADEESEGWRVGLCHPLRADQRIVEFVLRDRSLATSGSNSQFFYHRGRRYGHILDPRTGLPASSVLSATVLAQNATHADALSTAFYVLGVEGTAQYCRQHAEVAALLITAGEKTGEVDIHTWNLPPDAWHRTDGSSR